MSETQNQIEFLKLVSRTYKLQIEITKDPKSEDEGETTANFLW